MRIVVVAPDAAQFASAGVRIRYRRLEPHIRAMGHEFELVAIDSFRGAAALKADVCVFSKCHDARSLLMAELLREAGVAVGIDVFDDYFSDRTDSRFVHLRDWLRAMRRHATFALCATSHMRDILDALMPGVPVRTVNDPAEAFDADRIAATVERKVERARSSRKAEIGWFGIGDNPHFAVGLSDLAAWSHALCEVRRAGFEPRLSIVTNARSLDLEGLELIARLPVPCRVEQWSEALERDLLAESLFCFLPVNAQPFSAAKSLNRSVTTLASGCQALAPGFPLYAQLRPFVYDDVSTLMADVADGRPALRRETMTAFLALLGELADPRFEAEGLLAFLQGLGRSDPAPRRALKSVIHGKKSSGEIHKFSQRQKALSVASPFIKGDGAYDVRFVLADGETPAFALSPAAAAALAPQLARWLQPFETKVGKAFTRLDLSRVVPRAPIDIAELIGSGSTATALARYGAVMAYLEEALMTMFGDMSVHISNLQSPFRLDDRAEEPAGAADA